MAAPTEQQVDRIISGMNAASDAADYADTVVCEERLISGTRYKYVWTNEYDPGE